MNTLSIADEQLMAGWRAGDEEAFGQLYERYRHQVLAYIARLVWDRHLAEDCFQETFYRVFAYAGTYDPSRPFRPWLFRIATNVCRSARPQQPPLAQTAVDAVIGGWSGDAAERDCSAGQATADEVRAALLALTIDQRAVAVLHHFHDLSYPEIAQVLDLPLGTVKSRMNSALTALRRLLGAQITGRGAGCGQEVAR